MKNTNALHPSRKHVALDGRVRASPSETRSFSLFWAVTRTEEKGESNVELEMTSVTGSLKIEGSFISSKRSYQVAFDDANLPQAPPITMWRHHQHCSNNARNANRNFARKIYSEVASASTQVASNDVSDVCVRYGPAVRLRS